MTIIFAEYSQHSGSRYGFNAVNGGQTFAEVSETIAIVSEVTQTDNYQKIAVKKVVEISILKVLDCVNIIVATNI